MGKDALDTKRGFLSQLIFGGGRTTLNAFVMLGGRILSAGQLLNGLEEVGRELGGAEKAILRRIFGTSVDYDEIRIKEGYAGLASAGDDNGFTLINNKRALTHGSTIYLKYADTTTNEGMSTLVHETTHVWQHQNGGDDYMIRALHSQIFGEGYEFADAITKQNKTWMTLNAEQQAHLIELAYLNDYFTNNIWSGNRSVQDSSRKIVSPLFLKQYMDKVMPLLRIGVGAR